MAMTALDMFGVPPLSGRGPTVARRALRWSRDTVAFGQPIGRFQGVAFPLPEAATSIRGIRDVCHEAPWRKDLESVLTYEGTSEVHQLIIGQQLTGLPACR